MTREELRAALDSVTVVDAQSPARYGQRHLPGALNLVAEDSEEYVTEALPQALGPTAFLFEGFPRAGVDVSIFVTRTPPGRAVELHVHPYAETFLLLAGRGRWTRGEETVELEPEGMLVVPPDTPHGFRNVGDVPLLVVSVHERGTLRQTWLGVDPA
jgi:mannose-6-phosphate isomerase-like protein (cupin superfamily)